VFGVGGEGGEDAVDVIGGFEVEVFIHFTVHLGGCKGHGGSPLCMGMMTAGSIIRLSSHFKTIVSFFEGGLREDFVSCESDSRRIK
jgi:hypothetical protein